MPIENQASLEHVDAMKWTMNLLACAQCYTTQLMVTWLILIMAVTQGIGDRLSAVFHHIR